MNTQSVPRCLTDTFPLDPVSTHQKESIMCSNSSLRVTGIKNTPMLKIDMSKAYNRVEWPFLRNMMLKLGFHVSWVDLVMKCVTIMHYCTSHKGQDLGPILPERGLLHGGPIPPYMFILCVEGLSCLLQNRERRGLVHGCQVAPENPQSHIYFLSTTTIYSSRLTVMSPKVFYSACRYMNEPPISRSNFKNPLCPSARTSLV